MSETNIDLLYLSEPDTIAAGVTDIAACIDVMADTLRLFSIGDYRMGGPNANAQGINLTFPDEPAFATMPRNAPDRRFSAMPSYLGGDVHLAGVKWYGSNVDNRKLGLPRSIHLIALNDPETGAPLAVMAGNLVSAYRTAAVPGVGAQYLAAPDAHVLAVIGPGAMNRTSLEAFVAVRPMIDEVRVLGRSPEGIAGYVSFARGLLGDGARITVVDSLARAVDGADIVSVAATSPAGAAHYPHLDESWLKPGAFVSLPASTRLDEDFVTRRAHRVVDSRGIFEAWAAGLPFPSHERMGLIGMYFTDLVHSGALASEDIDELGQIVGGTRPGRIDDEQIHVLGFGGLPIEDVAWGGHVYRKAREAGIGTVLNLWNEPFLA